MWRSKDRCDRVNRMPFHPRAARRSFFFTRLDYTMHGIVRQSLRVFFQSIKRPTNAQCFCKFVEQKTRSLDRPGRGALLNRRLTTFRLDLPYPLLALTKSQLNVIGRG